MLVGGLGRLTRDCEVKQIGDGKSLCKFSIAVKDDYKPKEKTHFFDCVCFGKRGDVIAKYFHKGDLIYLTGSLSHETWTAKDGSRQSRVLIKVDAFDFCGGKSSGEKHPTADMSIANIPADNHNFSDIDIPF